MSNKNIANCAVVIPIYKDSLSADEEKSLRQCLTVLDEYPVIFTAPHNLNCEKYELICSEYKSTVSYEFFEKKFFSGVNGYSALTACGNFYKKFLNYGYILIYQLDAFVFENNLAFWCGQGYDYVGGPVFELQRGEGVPRHTNFLNGGFSLRKTETFHKLATKQRLNVFLYLLLARYDILLKKRTAFRLLRLGGLFFVTRFLYKFFNLELNEDYAWSLKIKKYGKVAPFDNALQFSFDSCPEYAFKLNSNVLPFGCHGWTAYYNRLFWEKHISFATLKKPEANL